MSVVQCLVRQTINNQSHEIGKIEVDSNGNKDSDRGVNDLAAIGLNVAQNFSGWLVDVVSPLSVPYHRYFGLFFKYRLKMREVTEFWRGSCH